MELNRILFFPLAVMMLLVTPGLLLTGPALAATSPKVSVCHFPPGNPDNYHTITISAKALPAHLAHGDMDGACNALCAQICDDGNACTVDDKGNCEQEGCPVDREPVDCSDGLACTNDSCNVDTGSASAPVECVASDLCHVSVCAEPDGVCVETPVSCPDGQACDTESGECQTVGVQITAEGEAYGHHGVCSGWNGCGDAATCAEWACQIEGYSQLVSYGDDRPCTQFANCHLFYDQNRIQYNWGNWCNVSGVTDIVCAGLAAQPAAAFASEEASCEGCETIR